jgi:hypothetical protein
VSKRVSRTRLNMLGGYAARDHRANVNQAKKACIRAPALAVRDGNCRVDDDSHSTSLDAPPSRKECKRHQFLF